MTLGKAQEIRVIWQAGGNRHVHWFLPPNKMKTTKPKEESIYKVWFILSSQTYVAYLVAKFKNEILTVQSYNISYLGV